MASTATETAAPEAASPWQAQILQQLEQADTDGATHAVITRGDEAQLVDVAESENAAVVVAEDWTAKRPEEEFTIVKLAELTEWADANGFAERPAGHAAEQSETSSVSSTSDGGDDSGSPAKLFEMPKIKIDTTQPSLIGFSFSGDINVTDRDDPAWTTLYNDLAAGKTRDITVTVYTAGAKKTHRRDKDGNVDAVVETKSLKITDVHIDG